jgi:hypothetical protein
LLKGVRGAKRDRCGRMRGQMRLLCAAQHYFSTAF